MVSVSGIESSSVILSQTKYCGRIKGDANIISNQGEPTALQVQFIFDAYKCQERIEIDLRTWLRVQSGTFILQTVILAKLRSNICFIKIYIFHQYSQTDCPGLLSMYHSLWKYIGLMF